MSNAILSPTPLVLKDRKKNTYLENQSELKQMWVSKSSRYALMIVNYVIVYLQNQIQRTYPHTRIVLQPYYLKNFIGIQYEISQADDNSSVVLTGTTNVIRFRPAKKRTSVIYIPINITKPINDSKFIFRFEHKLASRVLELYADTLTTLATLNSELEKSRYTEHCVQILNAVIVDRIKKA